MSTTIWVMDSDLCEMCDGLLDYFGECPHCGWDGLSEDEWFDEEVNPEDYDLDFDENGKYIGG